MVLVKRNKLSLETTRFVIAESWPLLDMSFTTDFFASEYCFSNFPELTKA